MKWRWISKAALMLLHGESLAERGGGCGLRDEGLLARSRPATSRSANSRTGCASGSSRAGHTHPCVSFNPTIPARIIATHSSRAAVAGSWNSTMPRMTVPTAPMPVQTA